MNFRERYLSSWLGWLGGNRQVNSMLDAGQWSLLGEHVFAASRLKPEDRKRYEAAVTTMVARRRWEGCDGLKLTRDMKTLIAGHAAVMLLGTQDYYFDSVNAILVFPGVIRRSRAERSSATIGEAWSNGGIVLSWPDVRAIREDSDGHNVVIHEFAHHLDGLDGERGGSIPFSNREDQQTWDEVSRAELDKLIEDVRWGRPTVLDPYGATNRAEFFAVCSECFFEVPDRLSHSHSELFELLKRFYHVNPLDWRS
jgi:MtfA peptidase